MSAGIPSAGIDALTVPLDHSPVPTEQVLAGAPTTADAVLEIADGFETGVWEHTPGTSTDEEIDELSVVLTGRATVSFDSGRAPLELAPGSVFRLHDGERTTWTVRETLRKLYRIRA